MSSNYSTLGRRVLVSIFGIPVVLGSMAIGRLALPILSTVIELFAIWELVKLAERKDFLPVPWPALVMVPVLNADLYFRNGLGVPWIVLGFILISLLWELFRNKPHAIANVSVSVFSALYMSLFSSFILIRELPARHGFPYAAGAWLLLMVFISMWVCDTAAYFVGSSFGKHKLFPRVSPKKTWEGAIAGFAFAIGTAVLVRKLALPEIPMIHAAVIGTLVGVFGQTSDLVESLLKRDAGVKDSSNLLPGHGGMLDRFDSPLLVGPIVYGYLLIMIFH
jgi:phosphatidate cytidylyltransferase